MFIVYKTTNKINKKFYIGVHCCNNLSIKARKQFLENNPMSSEESRKKVGLSKVGRKKMINSEGIWKYVKPEDFSIFLNNGYFFTG